MGGCLAIGMYWFAQGFKVRWTSILPPLGSLVHGYSFHLSGGCKALLSFV